MLVLSRKQSEQIVIGDNVKITILKVKGNTVRIGIDAPREVRVVRGELPPVEDSKSAAPMADVTVVFENDAVADEETLKLVPFTATERRVSTSSPQPGPRLPSSEERSQSIRFRQQLPVSLERNRLKELVDELTAKNEIQ